MSGVVHSVAFEWHAHVCNTTEVVWDSVYGDVSQLVMSLWENELMTDFKIL